MITTKKVASTLVKINTNIAIIKKNVAPVIKKRQVYAVNLTITVPIFSESKFSEIHSVQSTILKLSSVSALTIIIRVTLLNHLKLLAIFQIRPKSGTLAALNHTGPLFIRQ